MSVLAAAGGLVVAQGDFYTDRSTAANTCVERDGFCPQWMVDHLDDYLQPLAQHAALTITAVVIGFAIAFGLAVLAERRRWLVGPVTQASSILYTVPTLAAFFLLLPITGRGFLTAQVALVAYTLLILFRGVRTGLDGVAEETVDAARGIGLTERQVLWRVKVPLALPQIVAALRVASSTTVGLATLAFFAGAGGLGAKIYDDLTFKSNVVLASLLGVLLAVALEALLVARAAGAHAVVAGGAGMSALAPLPVGSLLGDALAFLTSGQTNRDGQQIGGPEQLWGLTRTHLELTFVALLIATLIAVPLGLWLGHRRKGELLAIATSNIGRAVPSLALIALFVAFLGTGFLNVALALTLLAIPPILAGTYVGVAAVDRDLVDAARGQGLTERQIIRQVELPLALTSIFGGLRTSAVNVVATATIAPLAGVLTLGDPIIATSVYGDAGRLGASLLVAALALLTELAFAQAQRAVTPKPLRTGRRPRRRSSASPLLTEAAPK